MPELIDLTLDPADLAGVHTLLASLETAMPFLVSLSADQVKSLFKLGPRSEAFVQKTLEAAQQHSRLLPASTSVAAMQRDAALRAALRPIRAKVAALLEMLDGTMILAGADLMKSASAVYRTLQIHAKGEGIDGLLEDLGKRFAKRRKMEAQPERAPEVQPAILPRSADTPAPPPRSDAAHSRTQRAGALIPWPSPSDAPHPPLPQPVRSASLRGTGLSARAPAGNSHAPLSSL